jgi:hypothetical protein
VFLSSNLISWNARKQHMISRSSTEEEYKAIVDATTEIVWLQTFLKELNIPSPTTARLWCDNIGVKYLSTNLVFYDKSKHIKGDYHFVMGFL